MGNDVVLGIVAAFIARTITAQTRIGLSANANKVTDLDAALGLGTNANSHTYNFVADDTWIGSLALSEQ